MYIVLFLVREVEDRTHELLIRDMSIIAELYSISPPIYIVELEKTSPLFSNSNRKLFFHG